MKTLATMTFAATILAAFALAQTHRTALATTENLRPWGSIQSERPNRHSHLAKYAGTFGFSLLAVDWRK